MFYSISKLSSIISCLLILVALADDISARTCRIVFPNRAASAPKSLYLFDGKEVQEVKLPRLSLSPVYKLPDGDLNLHFFTTAPSDLKNINPEAPSVEIPASSKDH